MSDIRLTMDIASHCSDSDDYENQFVELVTDGEYDIEAVIWMIESDQDMPSDMTLGQIRAKYVSHEPACAEYVEAMEAEADENRRCSGMGAD
jgi:hypothetical protein